MNGWTLALAAVLSFAAGWVWHDVFELLRPRKRRFRAEIDLTAAAARGELVHFDWSDPRT